MMTTEKAGQMIHDVARMTGLTSVQCARAVLSFEEAFGDDDDGPTPERRIAMLKAALNILKFHGEVSIN